MSGRAFSSHFQPSARSRFLARPSRFSIPAFIFLLFAFSIFVFIFTLNQIADDNVTKPSFEGSRQVLFPLPPLICVFLFVLDPRVCWRCWELGSLGIWRSGCCLFWNFVGGCSFDLKLLSSVFGIDMMFIHSIVGESICLSSLAPFELDGIAFFRLSSYLKMSF